jgi:hypothetical protein
VDESVLQTFSAEEGSGIVVLVDPAGTDVVSFNALGQRTMPAPETGSITFSITNPVAGACQPSGGVRCLNIVIDAGGRSLMCDPQRSAGDPQACP